MRTYHNTENRWKNAYQDEPQDVRPVFPTFPIRKGDMLNEFAADLLDVLGYLPGTTGEHVKKLRNGKSKAIERTNVKTLLKTWIKRTEQIYEDNGYRVYFIYEPEPSYLIMEVMPIITLGNDLSYEEQAKEEYMQNNEVFSTIKLAIIKLEASRRWQQMVAAIRVKPLGADEPIALKDIPQARPIIFRQLERLLSLIITSNGHYQRRLRSAGEWELQQQTSALEEARQHRSQD